MISNSNSNIQQVADSFGGNYKIDMGLKTDIDKGYKKFCEKRGLQVGWRQSKGGFSCKNREKES